VYWHYHCPQCQQRCVADWKEIGLQAQCSICGNVHYPPTPHEDRFAWLEGGKWTQEIEEAVLAIRGTICAVPGCYREHETLAPRVPASDGGRTSVDNLMPLCNKHAALRGERDWNEWLAEVKQQEQQDKPKVEITITTRTRPPEPEVAAAAIPAGYSQPILALAAEPARALLSDDIGPEPRLLVSAPFRYGPAGRLELDYDWQAGSSGRCRLYLLAWPRGDRPEIAFLGSPKFAGLYGIKEHLVVAGDKGTATIELFLPETPKGRWGVGVAVVDEGCRFRLGEFILSATT
jgi:hypothetical protein